MEKRRWRTRLIVVAVLAVLVLVFGPKKLGWLVPGPDEAVTGYVMYELFSGSGAHDPAGEGLEELRAVLDDTWVLWWGVAAVCRAAGSRGISGRCSIARAAAGCKADREGQGKSKRQCLFQR